MLRFTRRVCCESLDARINKITNATRLNSLVNFYSSREHTQLEMREVVRRCQDPNYNSNLYCHRQLPIILAHMVKLLDGFPAGLSAMKSIADVRERYIDCFDLLLSQDQPLCEKTERKFHAALEKIEDDLQQLDVLKSIATGVLELKEHVHRHRLALIHLKNTTERWKGVKIPSEHHAIQELQLLQGPLDEFNRQYVYYNFLSRQLLGLVASKPSSDMVGIVDKELDLFEVVKYAVSDACQICTSAYGDNPDVNFVFPPQSLRSHKFMHMGSTITYIIVELMKNALRATIETHMKRNDMGLIDCASMPPVTVLVNVPPTAEHACVCISDEGGGIPRSKMDAVMSYTFTTAAVPAIEPVKNNRGEGKPRPADDSRLARTAVMAGYGYGLPMSRVYAQCFGGDIQLQSVEGYGTKVYYYLKLN
jgi:pyruvate dehydrogenase kinase 2/3/4